MNDRTTPWYADGLRFSCTACGHCCRVAGHVWVDAREIRAIARFLELTLDRFGRRFLRRVGSRLSLVERPNHDCVFWDEGCTIYSVRPRQCRTFPFWQESIASAAAWHETASACEGVNTGRLYSLSEIEALRSGRGETANAPTAPENATPRATSSTSRPARDRDAASPATD